MNEWTQITENGFRIQGLINAFLIYFLYFRNHDLDQEIKKIRNKVRERERRDERRERRSRLINETEEELGLNE